MRIVTYNILDGGEGRADPLAEVIEAQRPDVVALVEAEVPAVVERIARRLSMDFVSAAVGNKHASALLSRWPIKETINHAAITPGLSRSFLEATVQDPSGQEWPIGVVRICTRKRDVKRTKKCGSRNWQLCWILFKGHRLAKRALPALRGF